MTLIIAGIVGEEQARYLHMQFGYTAIPLASNEPYAYRLVKVVKNHD
jgi:hypothetical protein